MGVKDLHFTDDDLDELSEKLALLYIQKCNKNFTSPKEFAYFFVNTQELISEVLTEISKNG